MTDTADSQGRPAGFGGVGIVKSLDSSSFGGGVGG